MSDAKSPKGGAQVKNVKAKEDELLIADKVDYVYTSHSQASISNVDFRLAFGDRLPPGGKVKPLIGVVMSHEHAQAFLEMLAGQLQKFVAFRKKLAEQPKTEQPKTTPE